MIAPARLLFIALTCSAAPGQADELRSLLPVACAASLSIETPFSALPWSVTPPSPAMASVDPFEMQLLTRNQHRVKIRSPRIDLTLLETGAEALLKSRLYPAQIQAKHLMKSAFRARAARHLVTDIGGIMDGNAIPRLVAQINGEIAQFGFEVSTIDFAPASFRVWERTCPGQTQ